MDSETEKCPTCGGGVSMRDNFAPGRWRYGCVNRHEWGDASAAPHAAPREGEPTAKFDLDAVIDPDFCGGLDPVTYLDRLHEQVELPDFARTLGLPNDASAEAILDALVALKSQSASQQAALDAAGEALRDVQLAASLADNEIAHGDYPGDALRDIRRARQFLAGIDRLAVRASHPEAL